MNGTTAKAYISDIRSHLRGSFVKNVSILASGTIGAQILTILSTPLLTRLYDPAAFGILGLFIAISSLITPISGLRYDKAIMLPKDDNDSANIFILSCLLVCIFTFFAFIAVFFFRDSIIALVGSDDLSFWLWFVPLAIFLGGIYENFNYWTTRRKKFGRLSASRMITSGSTAGVKISAGFGGLGTSGLIAGQLFGQAIADFVLGKQILREDRTLFKSSFNIENIKRLAKKYDDFPKYNLPRTFISTLSEYAPVFLFALFFNPVIVGLYTVTKRVIYLPVKIIGGSFRQVFYQKASERHNEGKDLYPIILKATLSFAAVGFIPLVVTIIFGPQLFGIILGDSWASAGVYAQLMIVWQYFTFISIPCVIVIQIYRLQKMSLYIQIPALLLSIGGITVGGVLENEILALALFVLCRVIYISFIMVYVLLYSKKQRRVTNRT